MIIIIIAWNLINITLTVTTNHHNHKPYIVITIIFIINIINTSSSTTSFTLPIWTIRFGLAIKSASVDFGQFFGNDFGFFWLDAKVVITIEITAKIQADKISQRKIFCNIHQKLELSYDFKWWKFVRTICRIKLHIQPFHNNVCFSITTLIFEPTSTNIVYTYLSSNQYIEWKSIVV